MVTDSVEAIENKHPANTAYVPKADRPEDEYDVEREGNYDGERKTVEQGFVIHQHLDPMRQRDPNGIYLDDKRRREAEVVRARVEGREPDFDNMGTTAGESVIPVHVAEAFAKPEAIVVPDFKLPVVVGDYERDGKGDVVEKKSAKKSTTKKVAAKKTAAKK